MKTLVLTLPLAMLAAQGVFASDITIADPVTPNIFFNGGTGEDNETEPGTASASNQSFDLERFTFIGSTLNLIAGFDMKTGVGNFNNGTATQAYTMGDIFIRMDKRVFDGYDTSTDTMSNAGWDYVIDITSFPAGDGNVSFRVIKNTGANVILTGPPPAGTANPGIYHQYQSGGQLIGSGTGSYNDNATAGELAAVLGSGLLGDALGFGNSSEHDILSIDLAGFGILGNNCPIYLHTTMDCGNDVIHGRIADGGMTLALLGAGLSGLAIARRRKA